MASITDILAALSNPDPAVRVPAEQIVTDAKASDLSSFILTILQEYRDESKPPVVRHMAGTLLKNAVAPSFRDVAARQELEARWKALAQTVRAQVKAEVLSTLGSPSREVRSVAASIIGSLSRIELPAGEWPELIQILVSGAAADSEQHQEAALTTLGYVCEEGHDHEDVEEALQPSTGAILDVVVRGMGSANEEVKYAATNALCNAMEYISQNMQQQTQRDYLVEALCSTTQTCQNVRTRECAMESLVKVAELYYSTLPTYMERLHTITKTAIFSDEESVGLQAMQFWISICEEERELAENGEEDRCLHYAQQCMEFLLDVCTQLLVRQEEDQTESDWNLSVAASKLLQSLAETVGMAIQAPALRFIFANINSADWHQREAAVMAFGCILGIEERAAQEAIQDTVAQAIPGLLKYMRDEHALVADTAAWVLAVVCEGFVDVFIEVPRNLQELLNIAGPMITDVSNPTMASRACHIVQNLALAYEEDEDDTPTNALSQYYADLVKALLLAIDNASSFELKNSAQETLNTLVDAAAADCTLYLNSLVTEVQNRLLQLVASMEQVGGAFVSLEMETMSGLLTGALGALARKLNSAFRDHVDSSMNLLLRIIAVNTDYVQDDALVAIGAIAHAVHERLAPFLAQIIPYVLQCLRAFDEPDTIYPVVGAIGDLCLGCGPQLTPFTQDIMNTLYENLRNNDVDRDLKCAFLSCISDVVLNVLGGTGFAPFMPALMPHVNLMFQASTALDVRGDPDGEDYVMRMWESIGGFYSAVIQCFKSAQEMQAVAPYLGDMLNFALHAGHNSNTYPETQQAALMVIGDMASVLRQAGPELRQQAKQALVTQPVSQLLQQAAQNAGSRDDKKQIHWIQKQLDSLARI